MRFSGSGGQGLITAAIIFAEAAGVYGGKHVCQTQSYGPEARGGKSKAEVVIDSSLVEQFPTSRIIAIPFTEIARNEIGKAMVANMVALGTIGILSGQVSIENLERSLLSRVPTGTEEINKNALHRGVEEGSKVNIDTLPRALMSDDYDM
jgi:2-oxoglutarate ferredoxin oxidoreductase subunit gamma